MLYNILLVLYVIIAVIVITLIMLQQGKGADTGALGGSGASNTVFGSSGSATFLSSSTALFATLFFLGSLWIANLVAHQKAEDLNTKVLEGLQSSAPAATQPVTPTTNPEEKKPESQPSSDPVLPNN